MALGNPCMQLLLLLASLASIPLSHCQSQAPDIAQENLGASSTLEHHHNPALPFCDMHLAKLPGGSGPHTRERLRDALQQLQLQHRIVENLRGMEERKQLQPSSDEERAMQKAHGTPLSLQELQQQLHAAQQELERLQGLLDASMQAMRQQGLLHSNTTEIIASSCLLGRLNPRLYPARPQISFMLQYYQRPWMISPILDALRSCDTVASEVVVNVDSADEPQTWAELAHNTSGWVVPVFSANVHEIRAYNRLAALARGKVVVVLQDDLVPPTGCQWQSEVLALFDALPRLAALGLKSYRFNARRDGSNVNITGREAFFTEPTTGLPFQYAQMVDFAPMALLRSAFRHVGGLDEGLSETGMCGIYSDFEISVRFWAAGWHVGFHPVAGTKPDQSGVPSGTHKPETEFRCWRRQMGLSGAVYFKRWVGDARPQLMQESLALTVRSMNLKRLQRVPNMHCPWSAAFGACDSHWAPTATLQ